jgi:hypothetical protein
MLYDIGKTNVATKKRDEETAKMRTQLDAMRKARARQGKAVDENQVKNQYDSWRNSEAGAK